MTELELILPWFPKELKPNGRYHYHVKNKKFQKCKNDADAIAKKYKGLFSDENIAVTAIFHQPTAHRRDLDNCLASIKSYFDGIADGLGVNDRQFRPIVIDFGEKVKGGEVRLIFSQ